MKQRIQQGKSRSVLALAVLGAAVVGGVGCSTVHTGPTVLQSAATRPSAGEVAASSDLEFWYQLARQPVCSNDDAFHAVLLHADGTDKNTTYESRVAELKGRGMLPGDFSAPADAAVTRGDLAMSICRIAGVKGGLTSQLFGQSPRYATRALMFEGLYPDSSPQQTFSGTDFVGVIGKLDDYRRGNPANLPAETVPGAEEAAPNPVTTVADEVPMTPLMLSILEQETPAAGDGPKKLHVIVTAVVGQVEVRRKEGSSWEPAKKGMALNEGAEFRTGDKASVQFNVPPGQTFTLDRLGTTKVLQAYYDGQKKVKTEVGLEQGRLRMDVNPEGPRSRAVIEEADKQAFNVAGAGVDHDTVIKSPNSALAVRGTQVSLLDQPPFAPEATSLTGRAEYLNPRRQLVAFGGKGAGKVQVVGDDSSGAQTGAGQATFAAPSAVAANQYELRQLNRFVQNGGFIIGDVVVGNAGVENSEVSQFQKGSLQFLMRFGKEGSSTFEDLNLAVLSPKFSETNLDAVANGPFIGSLNTNAPGYAQYRAQNFPKTSPSGGVISKNSVAGPEKFFGSNGTTSFQGAEIASWPANYPKGVYRVLVTNFATAPAATPGYGTNPVPFTVNVVYNGKSLGVLGGFSQEVGLFQTTQLTFDTSKIGSAATTGGTVSLTNKSKSAGAAAKAGTGKVNILPSSPLSGALRSGGFNAAPPTKIFDGPKPATVK
jgi:hypothetical protein